eukprot:c32915_g1_i1 orf=1-282(-)
MKSQQWIQNIENELALKQMTKIESTKTFIMRIKNLRDLMAGVGIKVMTEELARWCTHILPKRYDSLITSLNTQQRDPPLMFEDFSMLLQEEEL